MKPIYLNRKRAAAYIREEHGLRCAEKWLAKLVVTGGGPRFWKDGRSVLYRADALDAWAAARLDGPFESSSARQALAERRSARFRAEHGIPFEEA